MARSTGYPHPHRHPVHHVAGHQLVVRIMLGLLFVLAVASAVAIYFQQEDQFARMTARRTELLQAQAIAEHRHEDLLALKNQVDSDAYIERIAREKLGMVRPNEILFDDP